MSHLSSYRHPATIRRLVRSLVPVVCPPDAARLGVVDDVVEHTELSFRSFGAQIRIGLLAGLTTYELGGLAFGRPASRLAPDRAARYFATWWSSPLLPTRELAKGIKGIICLAYYEQPAVQAELGYTPQAWIEKVKQRRLEVYGGDIHAAAARLIQPDPLPGIEPRRAARAVEVVR